MLVSSSVNIAGFDKYPSVRSNGWLVVAGKFEREGENVQHPTPKWLNNEVKKFADGAAAFIAAWGLIRLTG